MKKNRFEVFVILLSAFLLYGTNTANAQNAILKDSEKTYKINYPLFLIDSEKDFKADEILLNPNFNKATYPVLSLGATSAAVWIKYTVSNQTDTADWYLQIDSPPVLQSVEVYQKQKDHLVKIFTRSAGKATHTDHIAVNNMLIPISIPKNTEVEYYIRATSNNILRLPIKVVTLQKSLEESRLPNLLNGITFGMLMAFAIYNFFVYLLTKEHAYLYYLGYIFFWSLNVFFFNGFLPNIFPSATWLNSAATLLATASILSIFFTNSFLKTKINSPFFYKISWLMSFFSVVVLFVDIYWKGPYGFIAIQYLMYPFFLYWFGAGLYCLKKGYKPALYFILGFGCLMIGNAIYNLKDLDILPDNIFTRTSMHWGALADALILSLALANRLNFYQKEKEKIAVKFLNEKRGFLKELLQRQEQEKKRVAMELHDNIGQQLILIKNKFWRLQQQSDSLSTNPINQSIDHVAKIMIEIRSILHRLRPYQMDLLGLTESINGMIADTFTKCEIEIRQMDDINLLFNANERIHIFRILQLLTDAVQHIDEYEKISYSIIRLPRNVNFEFEIGVTQLSVDSINDINNRLELLEGSIVVHSNQSNTLINVSIPTYI